MISGFSFFKIEKRCLYQIQLELTILDSLTKTVLKPLIPLLSLEIIETSKTELNKAYKSL